MDPSITVIMPVYNGEKYLRTAIDSVLNQTYQNFTLMIINDGSVDRTEEIIKSYKDARIAYHSNEKNLGIVKTLNLGLELAETRYIARFDADDICEPDRLEKQFNYMENHPDVAMVGARSKLIDEYGREIGYLGQECDAKKARTFLLFSNIFVHSSIMLRTETIRREGFMYDVHHVAVEDYGLWCKIAERYQIVNLPDVLIQYRINPNGIMANANENKKKHTQFLQQVHLEMLHRMEIDIPTSEVKEIGRLLYPCDLRVNMEAAAHALNVVYEYIKTREDYDSCLYKTIISGVCRGYALFWKDGCSEYYKTVRDYFKYMNPLFETLKYIGSRLKKFVCR